VAFDEKATGEEMCNNENPLGIKGGKLEKPTSVRYTYSVKWQVIYTVLS
jgi:hypothetical protein